MAALPVGERRSITVVSITTQAGVPLSYVGPVAAGDGYSIVHAGYTLAFSRGNEAHLQIDVTEKVGQYKDLLERLVTHGYRVA